MAMPTDASALQNASIPSHVTAAKLGSLPVTIENVPTSPQKSPRTERPRASHMLSG